jgi:hypothetical protein
LTPTGSSGAGVLSPALTGVSSAVSKIAVCVSVVCGSSGGKSFPQANNRSSGRSSIVFLIVVLMAHMDLIFSITETRVKRKSVPEIIL